MGEIRRRSWRGLQSIHRVSLIYNSCVISCFICASARHVPSLDLVSISSLIQNRHINAHQICYHGYTTSQGKHKKSARRNLDEVKTFLAKVDAHLAEIAETSGGAAAGAGGAGEPSAKSNKAEAKTPASGKKRKPSSDAGR